jgi:hypothetical protein
MPTRTRWFRIVGEGAVILVSILLAFGIDAWWDAAQDREDERQALDALAEDFESAAQALDEYGLVMDSIAEAANIILEWTGPDADPRHPDSLALLTPSIARVPDLQPPMGTLQALLGSGDLRLIRNDSLRAALASFPSQVARIKTTESYGADLLFGEIYPYLNRSIPLRNFARGGDGRTRFPRDVERVLRSLEFENLVQTKLTHLAYLGAGIQDVQQVIASIREMIDLELDG